MKTINQIGNKILITFFKDDDRFTGIPDAILILDDEEITVLEDYLDLPWWDRPGVPVED